MDPIMKDHNTLFTMDDNEQNDHMTPCHDQLVEQGGKALLAEGSAMLAAG